MHNQSNYYYFKTKYTFFFNLHINYKVVECNLIVHVVDTKELFFYKSFRY